MPTVSFSMRRDFREEFCITNVRSQVVLGFINFVLETCQVCVCVCVCVCEKSGYVHVHVHV